MSSHDDIHGFGLKEGEGGGGVGRGGGGGGGSGGLGERLSARLEYKFESRLGLEFSDLVCGIFRSSSSEHSGFPSPPPFPSPFSD